MVHPVDIRSIATSQTQTLLSLFLPRLSPANIKQSILGGAAG